jgi:hypothetical protein
MNRYKAMVYAKSPRTGLETEYFVGYVVASTIEEAIRVYEEDCTPWVTVEVDLEFESIADTIKSSTGAPINPKGSIKGLSYDSFMDCLEAFDSREEIESLIEEYTKEGESMAPWIKVMKQFLKDNYGDEDEEK